MISIKIAISSKKAWLGKGHPAMTNTGTNELVTNELMNLYRMWQYQWRMN